MKIIELSTRRPVTVFIFAVAALVFGLVALGRLATDLLPDITYPSLTVRTDYEGAAPIEVEGLVTRPIENAVGVVNGVVRESSSSRADVSEVTLEFAWGTNMDLAGLDVRERLDVLDLPDDAGRPVLLRYDPSLDPIVRVGVSGEQDLIRMRLLAEEEVKRALERIEGVAGVVVSGGLEEEIQVELDERRLANLGLTAERVLQRLGQENVNVTGGRLVEGQSEYLVRTIHEIVRAEELEDIVIASDQGALVRLRDVGRVVRGHKERDIITRIDGRESVEVAVYKEGGTNTVTVSDAVAARLAGLGDELRKIDPGLELTLITDQARYIRQSVDEVLKTAAYGGFLAILILYFFLRSWKTTFIISAAIPISVVATFFLMYSTDISLNIMSLGGLTLGIGLLVDNAIVVLEAVQRERDRGLDDVAAAISGAGQVGRAVVASTLTTICVFLPIVFVEGVAGQLFGDQALTVTFSLVVSLIVALTVIPMLASRRFAPAADDGAAPSPPAAAVSWPGRWLRGARRAVTAAFFHLGVLAARAVRGLRDAVEWLIDKILALPLAAFERGYAGLAALYARLLDRALARPVRTVALAVVLLLASLALYPLLGSELVPEMVQGEFFVDVELPPGTHLEVTARRLAAIERFAAGLDGVEMVYTLVGSSNQQGGVAGERRENLGQVTLRLAPPVEREREAALMERLRVPLDAQEDLDYTFGRPSYFTFRTPVELEIQGYNLELLARLAEEATQRLRSIPGLVDVKSSTEGGNPELQIHFDRERLASLGLNLSDLGATLRSKVQGTIATDIQREDRSIDIRLRADEQYRDSVDDLLALTVAQRGKTAIPLSAVAEVAHVEGPAEIRRAEGNRIALVTANLIGRDLGSVSRDIAAAMNGVTMPSGFSWQMGGQQEEMETSFDSMRMAILLAVFLVYLVMASQFESLLHPLVILFSIPFSLIGVLLVLTIGHIAVSIVVLIGVILLAGIVVNNAIILVDYTNTLRRDGVAKVEALRQAGKVRLRPIMMTTSTTVLGLLPMALGLGEGAELRTPMAWTVIGGLVTSTLLTLVIVPAAYTLVDRGD
jgi:hydrophobic/amphiphilic exporter-1 (mainly G- bacteria), HAE1 family